MTGARRLHLILEAACVCKGDAAKAIAIGSDAEFTAAPLRCLQGDITPDKPVLMISPLARNQRSQTYRFTVHPDRDKPLSLQFAPTG